MAHSSINAADRLNSAGPDKQSVSARKKPGNLKMNSSQRHTLHRSTFRKHSSFLKSLEIEDPAELLHNEEFVDAPCEIQAACLKITNTTLHEKKHIMDSLQRERSQTRVKLGCCEKTAWNIRVSWSKSRQHLAELRYSLELWSSSIKQIEGHFGTGVTSYFRSLRQLFTMNLIMMIVVFCFVTIPQIIFRYLQQKPPGYSTNITFTGAEMLTGGGWFFDTELYYGYYHNGVISVVSGFDYDMRYAYICVQATYYFVTAIILIISLSQSYRHHYIEESGVMQNVCVVKVLSGWDYKITSKVTSSVQHKLLFQELLEYLTDLQSTNDKPPLCVVIGRVTLRLLCNLVVLGILAGAGYLMWYITTTQSLTNQYGILSDLAMPLCITAINIIIPFVFSLISYVEKYKNPRIEHYLNMFRNVILHLVTLGVLVYSWFKHTVDCQNNKKETSDCKSCWENFIGEQIYSLVIFDFIFTLLIALFSEFVYRLINQHCCNNANKPEFNISKNMLGLIYSQILIWLGTFYSPLLCVIHIIKLIILFYIKRVSAIKNCMPSSKPWKAGQTSTFIQLLLFISFMAALAAVVYGVVFIAPSKSCGPYQSYNTTYQMLEELLDLWQASDEEQWIKGFIGFITSDAFRAYFLIALVVAAYYCYVIAEANEEKVKTLHKQIILESKDKKFLLNFLETAEGLNSEQTSQLLTLSKNRSISNNNRTAVDSQNVSTLVAGRASDHSNDGQFLDSQQVAAGGASQFGSAGLAVANEHSPSEFKSASKPEGTQSMMITNPIFRSESTERIPNLPYPIKHYSVTTK